MFGDIEDIERMDAAELHARRLNAKEVLTPLFFERRRMTVTMQE